MNDRSQPLLTYEDFLAYAQTHEGRFEYVDGQILDMGIASDEHQDLAVALLEALNPHLRMSGCKLRLAGRLRTGKKERSPDRAPDALVICDGKACKLVCEILSPDRGDDLTKKLDEYQAMQEFDEYLLIDSTRRWVRVYRRDVEGLFVFDTDHIAGVVRLASIGYSLDIDALYLEAGLAV